MTCLGCSFYFQGMYIDPKSCLALVVLMIKRSPAPYYHHRNTSLVPTHQNTSLVPTHQRRQQREFFHGLGKSEIPISSPKEIDGHTIYLESLFSLTHSRMIDQRYIINLQYRKLQVFHLATPIHIS